MVVRGIAVVLFALLLVPGAQASPLEDTCQRVVDNPYAPLLADCGPVGDAEDDVQQTFARVCHHANAEADAHIACWYYGVILDDPIAAWNIQCRHYNGNPEGALPDVDCYL